jgi:hypothetical protein
MINCRVADLDALLHTPREIVELLATQLRDG